MSAKLALSALVTPRLAAAGARAMGVVPRRVRRGDVRPLRLVLLVNTLAPYGAETFVLNHALHTDRGRFDLRVCYFGGPETLAPRFRAADVPLVCLGGRRSPRAIARLAGILRDLAPDILQTHVTYAGVVGRVLGRLAGAPLVVSTEQNMREELTGVWGPASDLTMGLADANVFISRAVARSFARVLPDLASSEAPIITNGIDTHAVRTTAVGARAEVRAELGLAAGAFAFAQIGRLNEVKGHRHSLAAFARVRASVPHASLWVVGGGALGPELRALAAREGVADAVHFLGERTDVHRLLGGFDAIVHPSRKEALGVAVLEAMAAGLPVLAAAVDGIPEFVRPGETGWLHEHGNVAALSEQMLEVARRPDTARSISLAGQALVARDHDIRVSVAAYEALYLRSLERSST
jgi:glycosyltransferase involved in cell wall biosynthesis